MKSNTTVFTTLWRWLLDFLITRFRFSSIWFLPPTAVSQQLYMRNRTTISLLSSWCGTDMISKSSNAFNRSFTPFRFFVFTGDILFFCKLIIVDRRSLPWSWHSRFGADINELKQYVAITMKLSFCPQKILLIRPLAKSFPVMGYGVGAHCMVVVENMVVEPGLKYLNIYVRCCYLYFVYIKFMFTNLPALHRPWVLNIGGTMEHM